MKRSKEYCKPQNFGASTEIRNVITLEKLKKVKSDQAALNAYVKDDTFYLQLMEKLLLPVGKLIFWYQHGWTECLLLFETINA